MEKSYKMISTDFNVLYESESMIYDIRKKLIAVDKLIGKALDKEPEAHAGEVGKQLMEISDELSWIDLTIYKMENDVK